MLKCKPTITGPARRRNSTSPLPNRRQARQSAAPGQSGDAAASPAAAVVAAVQLLPRAATAALTAGRCAQCQSILCLLDCPRLHIWRENRQVLNAEAAIYWLTIRLAHSEDWMSSRCINDTLHQRSSSSHCGMAAQLDLDPATQVVAHENTFPPGANSTLCTAAGGGGSSNSSRPWREPSQVVARCLEVVTADRFQKARFGEIHLLGDLLPQCILQDHTRRDEHNSRWVAAKRHICECVNLRPE